MTIMFHRIKVKRSSGTKTRRKILLARWISYSILAALLATWHNNDKCFRSVKTRSRFEQWRGRGGRRRGRKEKGLKSSSCARYVTSWRQIDLYPAIKVTHPPLGWRASRCDHYLLPWLTLVIEAVRGYLSFIFIRHSPWLENHHTWLLIQSKGWKVYYRVWGSNIFLKKIYV